jgi:hypothetical protein
MTDRRNIKVSEDAFRELSDAKPSGMTWDGFLLDLKDAAQGGPEVNLSEQALDEVREAVGEVVGDRVFREMVADEAPEWAGNAVIGAECDDCGHKSETVDVDHGANRGNGVAVCERCGGPLTKTLIQRS